MAILQPRYRSGESSRFGVRGEVRNTMAEDSASGPRNNVSQSLLALHSVYLSVSKSAAPKRIS